MHVRQVFGRLAASAAILFALVAPVTVQAAGSTVECGQLTGYAAPDPAGPTDGSLQLGLLPPSPIAAAATIAPAAATALPTIVNSGPTCVAVIRDVDDKITSLDFAPQGTITGHVTVDSGSGFYLLADRLLIPSAITDTYSALGALFPTSEAAGTVVTVSFTVNTSTGAFTGFDGAAAFCGAGGLTPAGDGKVGAAVIPKAVLDAADRSALAKAAGRHTCATVHSVGTIGEQGVIDTSSDVRITVRRPRPAPLPETDAGVGPAASAQGMPTVGTCMMVGALVVLVASVAISRRRGIRA